MRQDADRLLGFMHAAPRLWRDGILWWLDVSPAGAVERRISLRRSRGDAVGGGTMPALSRRASAAAAAGGLCLSISTVLWSPDGSPRA